MSVSVEGGTGRSGQFAGPEEPVELLLRVEDPDVEGGPGNVLAGPFHFDAIVAGFGGIVLGTGSSGLSGSHAGISTRNAPETTFILFQLISLYSIALFTLQTEHLCFISFQIYPIMVTYVSFDKFKQSV